MQMTTTDAAGNRVRQDFPWSFSHVRNFETCPHRYNQIDLLKAVKEPDSPHLKEGFYVHDKLAERINKGTPLPANVPFEKWAQYALAIPGKVVAEQDLAMTKGFTPCAYFRDNRVWMRTKVDVLAIDGADCHIIDWKTGKIKPEPDQLLLNATCAMVHHSQIFNIKAEFVWLGHDAKTSMEFTVDDVVKFWGDEYFERVAKLQEARNANKFPKKPNGLCARYCPVTSCEHCGPS